MNASTIVSLAEEKMLARLRAAFNHAATSISITDTLASFLKEGCTYKHIGPEASAASFANVLGFVPLNNQSLDEIEQNLRTRAAEVPGLTTLCVREKEARRSFVSSCLTQFLELPYQPVDLSAVFLCKEPASENGVYDRILILDALRHAEDTAAAIARIYDLLRKGGQAYVIETIPDHQTPIVDNPDDEPKAWVEEEKAFVLDYFYHRIFCGDPATILGNYASVPDWSARFAAAGFRATPVFALTQNPARLVTATQFLFVLTKH